MALPAPRACSLRRALGVLVAFLILMPSLGSVFALDSVEEDTLRTWCLMFGQPCPTNITSLCNNNTIFTSYLSCNSNGHVVSLENYGIVGRFPDNIGDLHELQDIWMDNLDSLFPPSFGNLTNLTRLEIQNVRLGVNVPSHFETLTSLEILEMFTITQASNPNCTNSTFPQNIGSLTALTSLQLSQNLFSGDGSVIRCGMTGTIPENLRNLQNLTKLFLSDNFLNGPLPAFFGEPGLLPLLRSLELPLNGLSGPLTSLEAFPNLSSLDLAGNPLSGPLPRLSTSKLSLLWIPKTNFTGSIPPEYAFQTAQFKSLEFLNTSETLLTGCFPFANVTGDCDITGSRFSCECPIPPNCNLTGGVTCDPTSISLVVDTPIILVQNSTFHNLNISSTLTVSGSSINIVGVFNVAIDSVIDIQASSALRIFGNLTLGESTLVVTANQSELEVYGCLDIAQSNLTLDISNIPLSDMTEIPVISKLAATCSSSGFKSVKLTRSGSEAQCLETTQTLKESSLVVVLHLLTAGECSFTPTLQPALTLSVLTIVFLL